MQRSSDAGEGGRRESDLPPSPSQRVQLEVEILASDATVAGPRADDHSHDAPPRSALIVTSDEGLSRYIIHCLGLRTDLVLIAADSVSAAWLLARRQRPQLIVADAPFANVIHWLNDVPAILIVDEALDSDDAAEAGSRAPLAVLVRPFNARTLRLAVDRFARPHVRAATRRAIHLWC